MAFACHQSKINPYLPIDIFTMSDIFSLVMFAESDEFKLCG